MLLLKGYLACEDAEFAVYIKHKKNMHNEGKEILDPRQLVADTSSFYRIAMENHQWKKQTPEHQKRVALIAQFEKLALQNKQLVKKVDNKRTRKDKQSFRSNKRKGGPPFKDRYKKNKPRDTPKWMKKPPTDGCNKLTKKLRQRMDLVQSPQVVGTTCRTSLKKKDDNRNSPQPQSTPAQAATTSQPRLELTTNMATVMEEDELYDL